MNRALLTIVIWLCLRAAGQASEDLAFTADYDGSEQRYVQVLPEPFTAGQPVDLLIALHGHGSDRWQFIRLDRDECRAVRDVARERGLVLIAPDYRARTSWMGPAAEADVVQLIAELRKKFPVRRVFICGASMGGASCLTFAALHPELVDGVVSMNGTANHVEYENFQNAIRASFGGTKSEVGHEYRKRSAELWAHRFTMPSAFTVGGQDRSVPPGSVLRLADQLQRDGRRSLLIHRETGGHSTTYADAMTALRFVLDQAARADASPATPQASTAAGDLRLTLPRRIYAVPGVELSVYFDNVILTPVPENYRFDVRCDVGRKSERRWSLVPTADEIGTHTLSIKVTDQHGSVVSRATSEVHVASPQSGQDHEISLLIVGDSLTHATTYPNELARLLSAAGNPSWTMLGTHAPASAAEGVRHEGYGGWTWERFASWYEPDPDGTYRKRSSPFVMLDAAGKPQLNVARYFQEETHGQRPDVVFFLLGINDCFSADPDDPAAIDARIDRMLEHAETLLAAFHKAAPEADLAICLTTPPNARESGFEANYQGRYHRWGWKRIQHRLVERLQKHFEAHSNQAGQDAGQIHIVPTHLNLDPVEGYPENNGVHPNAFGYRQIAASLYCWLKWNLSPSGSIAP